MVATAQQVRTSFVIAAAGAVVVTALLLAPRPGSCVACLVHDGSADDGMLLTAKLAMTKAVPGTREQDVAITITAPSRHAASRPSLSLAVVIDRSSSMNGAPMRNAKQAAIELVDQLDAADAFSIITYSSTADVTSNIVYATEANKATAKAQIARIWDSGGTCISCGIETASAELARSPIRGGLQRIVLISDGQANEGIWDKDELVALAGKTAARGMSISTVGVGLDFDELTMTRLADTGHGHYYFVEDTANLSRMFARELGGLTETVAADVQLVIADTPHLKVLYAYGYPMLARDRGFVIPVADLRAGETRKVVLHVQTTIDFDTRELAKVALYWRRVSDSAARSATAFARVDGVTDDANAVLASVNTDAVRAIEEARSSRVLEQATVVYERQGYDAAQRVLQENINSIRSNTNLDPQAREVLEGASSSAIREFAKSPPAKAMKANRASAYELAH